MKPDVHLLAFHISDASVEASSHPCDFVPSDFPVLSNPAVLTMRSLLTTTALGMASRTAPGMKIAYQPLPPLRSEVVSDRVINALVQLAPALREEKPSRVRGLCT